VNSLASPCRGRSSAPRPALIARSTFEAGGSRWQHAPTTTVEVSRVGYEKIRALVARFTGITPRVL